MIITRKNPTGGRPLRDDSFPLAEENGVLGYTIGYMGKCSNCNRGGGERILIRTIDAKLIANRFGTVMYEQQSLLGKLNSFKPRVPIKEMIARWLLGKQRVREIKEEIEEEGI